MGTRITDYVEGIVPRWLDRALPIRAVCQAADAVVDLGVAVRARWLVQNARGQELDLVAEGLGERRARTAPFGLFETDDQLRAWLRRRWELAPAMGSQDYLDALLARLGYRGDWVWERELRDLGYSGPPFGGNPGFCGLVLRGRHGLLPGFSWDDGTLWDEPGTFWDLAAEGDAPPYQVLLDLAYMVNRAMPSGSCLRHFVVDLAGDAAVDDASDFGYSGSRLVVAPVRLPHEVLPDGSYPDRFGSGWKPPA